jgi:septin 7
LQKAVKKHLNGYVGFSNLPNQIHRKSVKAGFSFTLMVVGKAIYMKDRLCMDNEWLGESGLGKSTLVNTLFNSQLYPLREDRDPTHDTPKTITIQSISGG